MRIAVLPLLFPLCTETSGLTLPGNQVSDETQMKNAIIVPSWIGHLPQATDLVQSFHEHCEDKRSVIIYIIVSEDEAEDFEGVPSHAPDTVVKIVTLQSLVPNTIDEHQLLDQLGKVSFQGLKKMVGLAHLPFQRALLLDSESLFVRRINLVSSMERAAREVVVVPNAYPLYDFQLNALEVANRALNTSIDSWAGMALRYQWIFEKSIVSDMLTSKRLINHEDMMSFFHSEHDIFPEIIYYTYLISQRKNLHIRMYDARWALSDSYVHCGMSAEFCQLGCDFSTHDMEHFWSIIAESDLPVVKHVLGSGLLGHSFTWTMQAAGNQDRNRQLICEEASIRILTSTDIRWFGDARRLVDLCPTDCVECERKELPGLSNY